MTAMRDLMVHPEWLQALSAEFDKPYMQALDDFLCAQRTAGRRIYPPREDIFRALNKAPPSTVRVVILGQDPYHGAGQAQVLCFSVARDRQIPPSLRNIFLELAADIACPYPSHGCLGHWAEQGVMLLNSVLTVEHGLPGSHHARGWEQLTNAIVDYISRRAQPTVFMLWGAHAQKQGLAIDAGRHKLLTAPHPSPLSARRGFFGCRHFSAANQFLQAQGYEPIDWQLKD